MKKNFQHKGLSLIELFMAVFMFSFFMLGIYTILDAGLKAWNIGRNRTDIQNNGLMVIRRMVKDINMANRNSLVTDPNGEYISLESPMKNGEFTYDMQKDGTPLWQGYITYYVYPRGAEGKDKIKTLYRRFITHPQRDLAIPITINNPDIFLNPQTSPDDKPVAWNVETFEVSKNRSIVNIKLIFHKEPSGENKNRYSVVGTAEKGTENFQLQASIVPKN